MQDRKLRVMSPNECQECPKTLEKTIGLALAQRFPQCSRRVSPPFDEGSVTIQTAGPLALQPSDSEITHSVPATKLIVSQEWQAIGVDAERHEHTYTSNRTIRRNIVIDKQ
jgi:hypothetical protein